MKRKAMAGVTKKDFIKRLRDQIIKETGNQNALDGLDKNDPDSLLTTETIMQHLSDLLTKVQFDLENLGVEETPLSSHGFEDIGGTNILWCYGGGDWECPVIFVVYYDPTGKLMAYIPENGNTYCHKCKAAFGSSSCDLCTGVDEDLSKIETLCKSCGCVFEKNSTSVWDIKPNYYALDNDVRDRLVIVDSNKTETIPAQIKVPDEYVVTGMMTEADVMKAALEKQIVGTDVAAALILKLYLLDDKCTLDNDAKKAIVDLAKAIKSVKTEPGLNLGIYPPSVESVLSNKNVKRVLVTEWDIGEALTLCSAFNTDDDLIANINPATAYAAQQAAVDKALAADVRKDDPKAGK